MIAPFAMSFRIACAVLTLGIIVQLPASAQSGGVVDEIVAVVGNEIVLRSEVDGIVQNVVQQGQAPYSDELWVEMLDQIVDQKVMAEIARRDTTIIVSDDQVDQAIDRRIQQLQRQVGGRAELERMYGKPLVAIRAELRQDFRNQLLAQQLQQRRMSSIRITPSEVRDWFMQFPTDSLPVIPETIRLSHIVRHPVITDAARDEAREILELIREQIVSGEATLEDLARQFSDDPGSAQAGGLYEEMRLAEVVPEFAAVAARSPIGEISRIFETPFGLHILRINDRRGDQINYNHILIEFDRSKSDPAPAIEFLSAVRDSITTMGAPFELMARRHSQENESSTMGGRVLDPRTGERELFLEMLGPTWRATIDTLEIGEVSQPARVQLLSGQTSYHLITVRGRVPEHTVDLLTDYERIEQLALQEKQMRELERWVRGLRDRVYIDMRGKAREMIARN
jgi:peptidyl-prolyl cis-trans isomerase SurA